MVTIVFYSYRIEEQKKATYMFFMVKTCFRLGWISSEFKAKMPIYNNVYFVIQIKKNICDNFFFIRSAYGLTKKKILQYFFLELGR